MIRTLKVPMHISGTTLLWLGALVVGPLGCAPKQLPVAEPCRVEVTTTQELMAAQAFDSYDSIVQTTVQCEQDGQDPDFQIEFHQFTERSDSFSRSCKSPDGDVTRTVSGSDNPVDGLYCAQAVRAGRVLSGVGFRLYDGTPMDLSPIASELGATEEEVSTLFASKQGEFMESESEDRVRVLFPPTETVETDVEIKLNRYRLETQPQPTYRVQAYKNVIPFQFCCGRSNLVDDPVQALNEVSLYWLKNVVPKAAKRKPVRVIGYSSTLGTCRRNLVLSTQRAKSVKRKLQSFGYTNIQMEPCGELGPSNDTSITVDQGPSWQRVDVVLAPEVMSFRFGHQTTEGKSVEIPEETTVTVTAGSTEVCSSSLNENQAQTIDLVMLIDTSGSMSNEWRTQIAPYLSDRVDELVSRFAADGYDAKVHVYTLGRNHCDSVSYSPNLTCSELLGSSLSPCGGREANESWGPGTSWAARFHPWRPGTLRTVLPISDELACEGDHTSSYEQDVTAVDQAVEDSNLFGVTVFPHYGSLHSGPTGYVQSHMWRLGHRTNGVAQPLDFQTSSSIDTVYTALLYSIERTSHSATVTCLETLPHESFTFTFSESGSPVETVKESRDSLLLNISIDDIYSGRCDLDQECPAEEAMPTSTKGAPATKKSTEPYLDCRRPPTY